MNVSAVNCTPIKPQISFNGDSNHIDYNRLVDVTDKLNDEFVDSEDIKKPLAAAASIGLAGLFAFASGKKIGSIFTNYAKKVPEQFENALKTGSQTVQNTAKNLINQNPDKISKVKNVAGKTIQGAENIARKGYKKLAYSGIGENITGNERATKAFQNVAGWLGLATVFPSICGRDADDDGVKDIMQKSRNAYTGTKTKFKAALDDVTKLSELAEVLM